MSYGPRQTMVPAPMVHRLFIVITTTLLIIIIVGIIRTRKAAISFSPFPLVSPGEVHISVSSERNMGPVHRGQQTALV